MAPAVWMALVATLAPCMPGAWAAANAQASAQETCATDPGADQSSAVLQKSRGVTKLMPALSEGNTTVCIDEKKTCPDGSTVG
eukprot:CAMPEP_0179125364 /NCGR_PEP_ID=MMETSP0796-20121207/59284_1 /TAXON_ID=73915 /ORGANISM="Pyrodinium bahamense, Strain pbaha01" /LENGTH=82 /DNA_ID=CAMNT_0020824057 /DNA_START=103 /DNA_END=347 /DNA_ORIENTATION=-